MSRENILIAVFFIFVLVIPALMVVGVYGRVFSGLRSKSARKSLAIDPNAPAAESTADGTPDRKP